MEAVKNVTLVSGGSDIENDSSFRSRIKLYLKSLARATPHSIESALLGAMDPVTEQVIQVAKVHELPEPDLGRVHVYVDNQQGMAAQHTDHNISTTTAENLVGTGSTLATAGQRLFYFDNIPVKNLSEITIEHTLHPVGSNTPRTLLLEDASGDTIPGAEATVNLGSGRVVLKTSAFPTGLGAGDRLEARYSWYTGILALAQKIIEGDPNDRTNYPGYRAAGVDVRVVPPTVLYQHVEAEIKIDSGFNQVDVLDSCKASIMNYVNTLGIGEDFVITELVFAIQKIPGVYDVVFTSAGERTTRDNVSIGEYELARILSLDVVLTGV